MKMNKKRISGILLSLALMVGLLSGMSLTAYADDPYAGIKNTTTVIHFDNKDWYLIDYDSSTVTLLSKEAVAKSKYKSSGRYVEYNDSDVKTVVDNWYNANISAKADTAVDAVSGNKMFLLTTEQALAIGNMSAVLKCPTYQDDWMWWLCSPGDVQPDHNAAQVNGTQGKVTSDGAPVDLYDSLVRPALKLNLSKVIFSSESNTFYPIAYVNLTGGANATTSGGATSQTGLTGAMTTVTYTANTGYQFPETSDLYTTTGGITVERTSDTVVTVSGTPTDIEVNVKVPDAQAKTYALTLDNQGATKPGANSVTATYDAVLPSIADNLPSRTGYTFDGYFSEKNGGGKQYLKADGTPTEEKWTKDDGGTLYAGWTPKPEANAEEDKPDSEKVITVSDNQPMAYSEETKGEFRIGYCHEIPFFGKAKPELKLFGNIKVIYDGKEYKATKIKVNKKKGLIRITGLDNADKDIVKAVKTATKGSNGLSFKVNPYYVKDTDTVTPKFKKDGSLKSVKVRIQGKDYKAKKGEFSYDQATKTVVFDGEDLKGSCRLP